MRALIQVVALVYCDWKPTWIDFARHYYRHPLVSQQQQINATWRLQWQIHIPQFANVCLCRVVRNKARNKFRRDNDQTTTTRAIIEHRYSQVLAAAIQVMTRRWRRNWIRRRGIKVTTRGGRRRWGQALCTPWLISFRRSWQEGGEEWNDEARPSTFLLLLNWIDWLPEWGTKTAVCDDDDERMKETEGTTPSFNWLVSPSSYPIYMVCTWKRESQLPPPSPPPARPV